MSKSGAAMNGTEIAIPNPEPSEIEPCVYKPDDDYSPMKDDKDKENVLKKIRRDVCERWGLSHQVFHVAAGLVLLLLVFAIVIIALAAAWPHIPHSQRFPVCKSPECLRGAAQIREGMNSSTSPCSDLWGWACGGWIANHPMPRDKSVWNQKQQLIQIEAERLRDLLTTMRLPLPTASVEWKLKNLYDSCINVDNINTDKARPLTNIIQELGGWYILRDWNPADFDSDIVLKQLQVKFGVSPFFKISVETDPFSPANGIIRISPSGLGLPDRDYYYRDVDDKIQNAYKDLIRDVVTSLSSTRSDAVKFGKDMFFYEQRIAEMTPSAHLLNDPIKTCNHIKISELKDTIPTIPFFDILTAMFPEVDISESTEVLVSSHEYLLQISHIIASTDRQIMNGYLIWTLMRQYLPYLSDSLTATLDNFNSELFGVRAPLKRWEFCADLSRNFMGLAVDYFLENRTNPITHETRQIVNETYYSILEVTRKRLYNIKSSKQTLHHQLDQKLTNLRLQVGLPNSTVDLNYLKDYYVKFKVLRSNFFENVMFAVDFKRNLDGKFLKNPSTPHAIVDKLTAFPPKVRYSPANNLVLVPRTVLSDPFFESKAPRPIIYGRLGVELAYSILSAVLPYGSFWTSGKKLLSPYHSTVNESLKSVAKAQDCVHDVIKEFDLQAIHKITNETTLEGLKWVYAVRIANEALLSSSSAHTHQPALEEYEDPALFFLSFAQTQCSQSTSEHQLYDSTVHFQLPQISFLHIVWSLLPEFADSLDCYVNRQECFTVF